MATDRPPSEERARGLLGGLSGGLLRGAAWNATATLTSAVTGLAVAAALARLLAPSDFGVQTVVVTVAGFFVVLAEQALGSAIVRDPTLDGVALSSLFWGACGASAVVYVALYLAAPTLAAAFGVPGAARLLRVAALAVVAIGATVVPFGVLTRRRAFRALATAQAAATASAGLVAIAVAAAGWGAWALVAQGLTAAVVRGAGLWALSGWRPALSFDGAHVRRVGGHAGAVAASVGVNYWSRNMDTLLIGRFVGVVGLGYYNVAYRLVGAPIQLLAGNVQPLLLPTLAALGDDVARQRAAYLQVVRLTALVMFPAAAVLWAAAGPLVGALAGPTWEDSVPVVRALAPLAAIQPVNALSGPVLVARGASGLMLRLTLLGAAAVLCGMALGLPYGAAGVAHGYVAAYVLVAAPASSIVAIRVVLGGRARDLARALLTPALVGGAALALAGLVVRLVGRLAAHLARGGGGAGCCG